MIVVVGAEMVFVVELAGVAFIANCAVEEPDGGGEWVISRWHCNGGRVDV